MLLTNWEILEAFFNVEEMITSLKTQGYAKNSSVTFFGREKRSIAEPAFPTMSQQGTS